MAVLIEGATVVWEYRGNYANVLTYKQCCDACGYLASRTSVALSMLPHHSYETEGFVCPSCGNHQTVKAQ